MFDKNQYKEMFRRFVETRSDATEDEALEFCRQLMPAHLMASHYWLVESCLQWFKWVKAQNAKSSDSYSEEVCLEELQ